MCGRYDRLSRFERIAQLKRAGIRDEAGEPTSSYCTQQPIRATARGPVMELRLWGIIPFWAKVSTRGVHPISAKCDTAAEKPMFRKLIRKRIRQGRPSW